MKQKVYSILDVNVGYGVPIVQDNDAVAMRNFENACTDERSVFATHSSDFSLWCVGTFDTDTGILESGAPEKICNAYDFVSRLNTERSL